MSRYKLVSPGWPTTCSVFVGWDEDWGTYFTQVIDTAISQGDDSLIVSLGSEPLEFCDLEELMQATNRRIGDRLPPIRLPQKLRRLLSKDKKRPVLHAITLITGGERAAPAAQQMASRPWSMIGSPTAYLNTTELRQVLVGITDQFHRLQVLYRAKLEAGLSEHNDESTKLIRWNIEQIGAVYEALTSMVQVPHLLVARAAMKNIHAFSAEAAQVLHAESTNAGLLSTRLH